MATLREYYEKDFSNTLKVHIKYPFNDELIEGIIHYDFVAFYSFISLFVEGEDKMLNYFVELINSIGWGETQVQFDNLINLPSAKDFPGKMEIRNHEELEIIAQFFGDEDFINMKDVKSSQRIFIYSESQLDQSEIKTLKDEAIKKKHTIQFRSNSFCHERGKYEIPLAFISHDSKDKDNIAKPIALNLQRMLCPVWYDEFSLQIGDNLRESIEDGLKNCKKCILVLSHNFINNKGWTKREFETIFTREILEEKKLILPIWVDVSEKEIFDYSPSLLNIKGLIWNDLGEDEVCKQLYRVLI